MSLKLYYSDNLAGMPEGFSYRNPRHFTEVEPGVAEVRINGDHPIVSSAYRVDDTCKVEVVGVQERPLTPDPKVVDHVPDTQIPANWRDLEWPDLRRLAATVSGNVIINKAQAEGAIEKALKDRGNV